MLKMMRVCKIILQTFHYILKTEMLKMNIFDLRCCDPVGTTLETNEFISF